MCLQKSYIKEKLGKKSNIFIEDGVNKPRTLRTFDFRCRIKSVKHLVFGVNILLDTNTKF